MNFQKCLSLLLLMRLHKPIGIYLLLWPTLIALWLAGLGHPDPKLVVIFILGVIVMRSAGCVVNDLLDRNYDPFVSRTQDRPIAAGTVSLKEAMLLLVLLLILAFVLVLQLNILTLKIAILALLITLVYPLMKRYTHFAQGVLGAAFGIAIPMVFAAVNNAIPNSAWLLYAAILLWTVAFDTEYAMKDRAEDLKLGLKSTAIFFGKYDCLMIGVMQGLTLVLFALLGPKFHLGVIYYLGIFFATGFIIYQQYLIKNRDPDQCFQAFLNNHYLGFWLFATLVFDNIIRL